MKYYKNLILLLLVLVSSCIGCTTIKKEGVDAHFEIITSDYINPDHQKESRPLNISLFYLTDTEKFLQADYFDLFQSEIDSLAGSLIQQSNVLVLPNNRKLYSEEIPENVRAIGVIYQFRKLDKSQWRSVIDTPETCFLGFNCKSILHGSKVFISIDELNTKITLVD
ncbi:MAG: type VI secretion system protein VasD [Oleispira sp.]|jgi:type VI secretion system protein VasD